MSLGLDRWIPTYADHVAVTANFIGETVLLDGASGASVQAVSSDTAVGTVYIEGTNQPGSQNQQWYPASNMALSAGGTAYATFTLSDPLTALHAMRVRFVATTPGTITLALNVRRTTL